MSQTGMSQTGLKVALALILFFTSATAKAGETVPDETHVRIDYSFITHAMNVELSDADALELNRIFAVPSVVPSVYMPRPYTIKYWENTAPIAVRVSCWEGAIKTGCSVYVTQQKYPSATSVISDWKLGERGTVITTDTAEGAETVSDAQRFCAALGTESPLVRLSSTTTPAGTAQIKIFETSDRRLRIVCREGGSEPSTLTIQFSSSPLLPN